MINFMYCKFVILLKLNKMCIFKGFNVNFLILVIIPWLDNLTKIKLKLHIYYNALKWSFILWSHVNTAPYEC